MVRMDQAKLGSKPSVALSWQQDPCQHDMKGQLCMKSEDLADMLDEDQSNSVDTGIAELLLPRWSHR